MKKNQFYLILLLSFSSCTLPNAGPLAKKVENTKNIEIVTVTPSLANSMIEETKQKQKERLEAALRELSYAKKAEDYRLQPGDTLQISLWSFSSPSGNIQEFQKSEISPTRLGDFQINSHGNISLPYIGLINTSNKTQTEIKDLIKKKFQLLKIWDSPDITVNATSNQNGIIVTGSIGDPKILSWNPGGVSLARAITLALGNGTSALNENSALDNSKNAINVAIIRNNHEIDIPIPEALANNIQLEPADKIIIRREPAVKVTVLGGGISKNGLYGFSNTPSLASIIAEAQGLNPNTANSTKIFVFRRNKQYQSILYVFSWKDGSGIISSQLFPINDGDIIYVAESPIIPISRVINTIFQMALPATIAR
ncbi:polysaccharide biosynthesis/export family protein [Zymomonas mobilis]|uniref:polysaccharide biosynthesis/export family protein n=1 Tax=Zymomonas mobilis TaxID=542 RepID=UPI0039EBFFF2